MNIGKKVSVISLGCDKNRTDTERMLYILASAGYEIEREPDDAEIIVVNTCAFIEPARKEAIETILTAAKLKSGKCEKLIVTGCLPQKYSAELFESLTEADALLGAFDYSALPSVIDRLYKGERVSQTGCGDFEGVGFPMPRILTTPPHYAYLKIADGCDNFCTYCTIPSIRGKYVSRPMENVIREAEGLIKSGVKEIILVAQDLTRYGGDLYGEYRLTELIKKLSDTGAELIRLMYCYPELVTGELLKEISNNPLVAKYVDIPIQHYDDGILKLMNRRTCSNSLERLMDDIAAQNNYIAVRTTVMTGFPGETEEQFEKLYRFLERRKLHHVGVFTYSTEEDTPSAKLKGRVPEKVKRARAESIGKLHFKNAIERTRSYIGKTMRVLYEDIDYDRNMFAGRTQYDAPEIDSAVYFTGSFADVGNFYNVKITGSDGYDLIGEIIE